MPLRMDDYPDNSPLISPELERQLSQLFDKLTCPVSLVCMIGEDTKSSEMASFLRHITKLSPQLSCAFYAPGEESDLDAQLDSAFLPATGVYSGGEFGRMVFHGVPGGQEITSFAAALLNAGRAARPLDRYTKKDIGRIREPLNIQVCVSLGCHHCAQLVLHTQRLAWENPMVTSHMIDANLYPSLVERYQIQRVPMTVLNGETVISGGKTMMELTTLLAKL